VTQVPHAQLIAVVFGAEGDVAGLLQFSAQLQVDRIGCIRQVAASLQNSRLDDKTIGWGATGKSAWGQNRLCGAPRLRRDRVELDKRHIIHPQDILQPERAANLRLETVLILATSHCDITQRHAQCPHEGRVCASGRQRLAGARRQLGIVRFW